PATLGPTKEEYQGRRRALMKNIKEAEAGSVALRSAMLRAESGAGAAPGMAGVVVVLVGAGEPGEDAKFRQENDFGYLTGVDLPQAAVILRPESGEETL